MVKRAQNDICFVFYGITFPIESHIDVQNVLSMKQCALSGHGLPSVTNVSTALVRIVTQLLYKHQHIISQDVMTNFNLTNSTKWLPLSILPIMQESSQSGYNLVCTTHIFGVFHVKVWCHFTFSLRVLNLSGTGQYYEISIFFSWWID